MLRTYGAMTEKYPEMFKSDEIRQMRVRFYAILQEPVLDRPLFEGCMDGLCDFLKNFGDPTAGASRLFGV